MAKRPLKSRADRRAHTEPDAERLPSPASLFRDATRPPVVTFNTFFSRYRRLVARGEVNAEGIAEALYVSVEDFIHKYRTRRTVVILDGRPIDLASYFSGITAPKTVSYSVFRQRLMSIRKRGMLDPQALLDAATLDRGTWCSFYGGGRHATFIYAGDEFPELVGHPFHGIAAFLRVLERWNDRALIWGRLKAGWPLDDALVIPSVLKGKRKGSIYCITRRNTGQVYVGLTVMAVEQRWMFHLRRAAADSSSPLHTAIREDGPDGFEVKVLEEGISSPNELQHRERHWIEHYRCSGAGVLNAIRGGGLGSPRGKPMVYLGEEFRSLNEAADVLSERLGIARHVVLTRLRAGKELPSAGVVRRHSDHPDAGTNLFRRWLALCRRHPEAVSHRWLVDYDAFKADVSPAPLNLSLVRKNPNRRWGARNFEWVDAQEKVERTHGTALVVLGVAYPSLTAVAAAFSLSVSTLKDRIRRQGMKIDEAVAKPLGVTSARRRK